jgi:hypothetical protein
MIIHSIMIINLTHIYIYIEIISLFNIAMENHHFYWVIHL